MLEYNEITPKRFILLDDEPYEVIDSHVFRMQQRKPQNKTKLRNLLSGRIVERTFHQSEKAEEADLSTKPVKFIYANRGEWWFNDEKNASNRFKIEEALIGPAGKFLKANTIVDALVFDEKIIGVKLPIKMDLKVVEAPPAVKGDTAKGGNKQITLETGAVINAPLFISEGEIIRINTETGEYVERAGK